jgi:DNA topoisomerase-3
VKLVTDEFVKDGETIAFQRVYVALGARGGSPAADLRVVVIPESTGTTRTRGARRGSSAAGGKTRKRPSRRKRTTKRTTRNAGPVPPLEGALRAWRTQEAKKRRVPAFRILTDRTLLGIASMCPATLDQLLGVAGMGPALLKKYGAILLSIVARPTR